MSVEHVQTKREIQDQLSAAGLKPRRRLGQHFLIDGNLMRRLVQSAAITSNDVVLEVGGGTGGLTDLLLKYAGHVICVEMDAGLHALLAARFSSATNLTLVHGDVLEGKHRLAGEVASLISRAEQDGCTVKLAANLPYNAATPLVMNLLEDFPAVRRLCFTVQAEVAERILSPPGLKTFGPLSILSRLLCDIQTVAHLRPHVFWPAPSVESVMLRMDVVRDPFPSRDELHSFATFVRKTFEHRRKTLRSALAYVETDGQSFGERHAGDALAQFDLKRRPEALSAAEWPALFAAFRS